MSVRGAGPGALTRLLFRLALLAHARAFRERHGAELMGFLEEAWSDATMRGERAGLRLVLRLSWAEIRAGLRGRIETKGDAAQGEWVSVRRDGGVGSWLRPEGWGQDARHAARALRRSPGFAVVVIGTLALGLGATTAVYGVLRSVLLAPLPYEEPDRLTRLYQAYAERPDELTYVTAPAFVDYRARARMHESLAALYTYSPTGADVLIGGEAERVRTLQVSADYFAVLRAGPVAGRVFTRSEERSDARLALVSEAVWNRIGGGDLTGESIALDGIAHDVIGVMPSTFADPIAGQVDVWLPLDLATRQYESWEWDNHYLTVIGRMPASVPLDAAVREIEAQGVQQGEVEPTAANLVPLLVSLEDDLIGNADAYLYLMMGAVAFLLLIACVNVASVLLARAMSRAKELAVRAALGSSRWRLVRQFLLEGLLLALAGGAAGLTIAWAGSRVLSMLAPADLPRANAAILDVPVFLFGLLLALVCGVALSVAPALSVSHTGLERALRGSGRGATVSRTAMSVRRVLTVAEVALALILVVGAGLLIASVHRLRQIDLGLDASNVIVFDVNLPETRYAESATRTGFHQEYQRRLSEQPGVSAVGAISWLPVSGPGYVWGTRLASSTGPVNDRFVSANQRAVQGEYFAALGIAVLRGRQFGAGDVPGAPPRSVINGSLASALFPDGDAVGGHLWISGQAHEIIGVVEDVALDARGTMAPVVYHPYAQFGAPRNWRMTQVVSFERETGLLERARNELRAVDPGLVLHSPRLLSDVVGTGTARERFAMTLLVAFALLAVLLAALGIYGVLANAVARRRREIGVRLALGARDEEIRRMVVGQGVGLAAIGVGFGIAGALALSRLLASLLFEVSPADPRVLLAAAAGVVAVAVLASWVPARAATRVSPVEAFGTEGG